MGIAENIKKLREKYGLTQEELAKIAGVTNKAVSTWETGAKEPRMGAIEKIANHFGIKKSNLIEDGGMDEIDQIDTIAAHYESKMDNKAKVLAELIDKRGSRRAFAEEIGMPLTTLQSMLTRGVGRASTDNVIKVCRALGITVEQLEEMANKLNEQDDVKTITAHQKMGIVDRLERYMKEKGISRMQLSKETGIPYTTIVNFYERGTDNIKLSTLRKLADYLNCSLDELVGKDAPRETESMVHVPIVGAISCGDGVIAYEEIEEYQTVPKEWVKGGTYFFLRAKGDSMIGARIHDGDLLLIRQQDTVQDGEIAAVLVNDEAYVKRVFFRNGMLVLQSENPNYPPAVYDLNDENVRIIGKLKKIIIDV